MEALALPLQAGYGRVHSSNSCSRQWTLWLCRFGLGPCSRLARLCTHRSGCCTKRHQTAGREALPCSMERPTLDWALVQWQRTKPRPSTQPVQQGATRCASALILRAKTLFVQSVSPSYPDRSSPSSHLVCWPLSFYPHPLAHAGQVVCQAVYETESSDLDDMCWCGIGCV